MMTTTPTRRRLLAASGASLALGLAGCAGDLADESGDRTADAAENADSTAAESADVEPGHLGNPAGRVTVVARSIPEPELEPGLVHIEPGGVLEWEGEGIRNATTAYHPETHPPLRIPEGADPWNSGVIRSGDTFAVTLDEPGIYDYADTTTLCGTHEAYGVVGRIVVGWPDLDGQQAIQADLDELPSRAPIVMDEYNERCREVLGD